MTLREDMEQYLEVKHLPLSYPSTNWTKLYIGVGSGTWDYSGNPISTSMDLGPAEWCSNTLSGMTTEMHNRMHIQRIEDYSVGGFIVGTIGVLLGLVSIFI